MKASILAALAVLVCQPCSHAAEDNGDDGGFHSMPEYQAAHLSMYEDEENIDDIFDTRDLIKRLAAEKRVRLFRQDKEKVEPILSYNDFEHKPSLKEPLGKLRSTIEVAEADLRPVLALATDLNNYGSRAMCGFRPGIALIIGGDEPDYVIECCFECHDILIVRRPTAEHPMPHVSQFGMSPELEKAVFTLARTAFPDDKDLQAFKLEERTRSKTPLTKETGIPKALAKDPFK
jgi:hypothetical protein